jgi:hypothetical protein
VIVEAAECCIDAVADGLEGLVSDLRWTSCDRRKAGNDADGTMKAAEAERVAAAVAAAREDWDCAVTTRVRKCKEMKGKRMRSLSDSRRNSSEGMGIGTKESGDGQRTYPNVRKSAKASL